MEITVIVIVLVGLLLLVGLGILVIFMGGPSGGSEEGIQGSLRNLVSAQRDETVAAKTNLAVAAASHAGEIPSRDLSPLEQKLRSAQWKMSPLVFRLIQLGLATVAYIFTSTLGITVILQFCLIVMAPVLFDSVLSFSVGRRFSEFDKDYPVLLMQYVSLLKTGMGTIKGLETAAKGLDEGSLVRLEVEMLVERLRLGLTEEQAINMFGENIEHPEIELFVQSLLLSRKVGGGLSTTLERLAKQVRKRQQFRQQAEAAVGMERGSIYMIAVIMAVFLVYLGLTQPELIGPAFTHPTGTLIAQSGFSLVLVGFFWSKQVTKLKV